MKVRLNRLNKYLPLIKDISREAKKSGVHIYLVGGIVRDVLLKRSNFDLDIVVEGDAIKLAKRWAKKRKAKVVTYEPFGTATVTLRNGSRIDFAMARKETYAKPGALPKVKAGSIRDDLFRRDFTINAMAIALDQDRFGQLVDEFDSLKDLKAKCVRILHNESFVDDPTRILRAIRFEQRLSFKIELSTLNLMKKALILNAENAVKPGRMFDEFKKTLQESNVKPVIKRMLSLNAMKFLESGFVMDKRSSRLFCEIPKNIRWANRPGVLESSIDEWVIYLMALCEGVSVAKTHTSLKAFHVKKSDITKIIKSRQASVVIETLSASSKPSEVYDVLKSYSVETLLFFRSKTLKKKVRRNIDAYIKRYSQVQLKIGGHDLLKVGFRQDKGIKKVLEKVLLSKIDGQAKTKREELAIAQECLSLKESS